MEEQLLRYEIDLKTMQRMKIQASDQVLRVIINSENTAKNKIKNYTETIKTINDMLYELAAKKSGLDSWKYS